MRYPGDMNKETKVKILSAAKAELMNHGLSTFVERGREPPDERAIIQR